MSKFVDRLEAISQGRTQPIGFGAAVSREKRASMLIVAAVPLADVELAAAAAMGGADAVLAIADQKAKTEKAMGQLSTLKLDIPLGVSLPSATRAEVKQLTELKCDFVVVSPARTEAAALREEAIGKIIRLDSSLDDNLLRAVNRLDVDAVLLGPAEGEAFPLTVQQVMAYERLAAAAGKHLLAAMPPAMPSEDLETLWGLGAAAVVVDLGHDNAEKRLNEVKEAVEKLPLTRKKRAGRISAAVPFSGEWASPGAPDEEEEEEEV